MMATALTWAELCESPAPASINAPAVATLYGRQRPYTSNAWTVRQRWNWLHLNRGIQFPHLVAAAGSDLGRFAVSALNRAETSSPVSKWNALTFICFENQLSKRRFPQSFQINGSFPCKGSHLFSFSPHLPSHERAKCLL